MFLAVNATGQVWTGEGWSVRGREFFSPASCRRSLHEGGQDLDDVILMSARIYNDLKKYATTEEDATRKLKTGAHK